MRTMSKFQESKDNKMKDNNEDRLTLGQNAKIRAENELNWDIQIKKYNDLIKEIQ